MTDYELIPKILAPRAVATYDQKVPKIIWQTMKTNLVPVFMKKYADTWINLNPEYEYRFCDDTDAIDFIKAEFPAYVDGYSKLKYGASKADLWRYLIIYKYGGVYADMDCKCLLSLKKWINADATFVSQLGINKDICQWLIISVPQNPIFLKAAQQTLYNSENDKSTAEHYGFELSNNELSISTSTSQLKFDHKVLGLSGPPVLQAAAEACLQEGLTADIFKHAQIVCVSTGSTSCQMNGYVKHDTRHEEYILALSQLKLNHYNNRTARIKSKISNLLKKFIK